MLEIKPGDKFGRLAVVKRLESSAHGNSRYLCLCDCGKQRDVRASALVSGLTKSCGCFRRETMRDRNREFWKHYSEMCKQTEARRQQDSSQAFDYAE
jgi:hypothetical protein